MLEFISTSELTFLGFLTLVSFMMIIFSKDTKFLIGGTLIISMIMVIAYTHHCNHLDKEFVLKRFDEGKTIECGLFKGERTLIHANSDWTYQPNIGFIKNDRVHNDPSQCNVIDEEAPSPSVIPYLFALMIELMVCFGLRSAVQSALNENKDGGNNNVND